MITREDVAALLSYDERSGVFTWRKSGSRAGKVQSRGYVQILIRGRAYYAHRLAWFYVHGEWPPSQIDHINCEKADNRIANLRLATRSQNQANRGVQPNNTSGFKGVTWCGPRGKWRAEIKVNRRKVCLGSFERLEDAAVAYEHAAKRYFGEFARIN